MELTDADLRINAAGDAVQLACQGKIEPEKVVPVARRIYKFLAEKPKPDAVA